MHLVIAWKVSRRERGVWLILGWETLPLERKRALHLGMAKVLLQDGSYCILMAFPLLIPE